MCRSIEAVELAQDSCWTETEKDELLSTLSLVCSTTYEGTAVGPTPAKVG
jgi:hypothetical protein